MEKSSKVKRFRTKVGSLRLSQIWDKCRKPFNFLWKSGVALTGIVIVVSLVAEAVESGAYMLGLKHLYWKDESLGEKVEIRYFSNDCCAAFDKSLNKRLSPKVRWISGVPERDSLTVFCDKDGKRGYLNVNTGKVVIDGQYKHAWHFSEGLAAVVADNGKVGFINYDNEMVIPAVYDFVSGHDYLFRGGFCVVPDELTDKYGAVDRLGVMKLPMEYSRICVAGEQGAWYIRQNGKCGLADADMNIVFEPIYDNVVLNGSEDGAYLTLDGIKQLVSFDGEVLVPFVIDESWPLKYIVKCHDDEQDEYEIHPYLLKVMVDYGCLGVMDSRTGRMIVPAIYSDIRMASNDIIIAEIDDDEENNIMFSAAGMMIK